MCPGVRVRVHLLHHQVAPHLSSFDREACSHHPHFSEASERCQAEKRKTINGEDILFAMSTLGFDNYVEPLKLYLQKYREAMKGERQIESELTTLGGDVMTAQQLQSLATTEGDVLLTYTNGQQFQL